MMWNDGAWGWGDWFAMSLMMLVVWGLLVGLVVWLVRGIRHESTHERTDSRAPLEGADEVLAERFARGEIDAEEFERRRAVLHNH